MPIVLKPDLEQRIAQQVESGRYQSADQVVQEGLDLLEARNATEALPATGDTRPIWEIVAEISRSVPDEEWARIPADSSINLDHYLYGAPKVSE